MTRLARSRDGVMGADRGRSSSCLFACVPSRTRRPKAGTLGAVSGPRVTLRARDERRTCVPVPLSAWIPSGLRSGASTTTGAATRNAAGRSSRASMRRTPCSFEDIRRATRPHMAPCCTRPVASDSRVGRYAEQRYTRRSDPHQSVPALPLSFVIGSEVAGLREYRSQLRCSGCARHDAGIARLAFTAEAISWQLLTLPPRSASPRSQRAWRRVPPFIRDRLTPGADLGARGHGAGPGSGHRRRTEPFTVWGSERGGPKDRIYIGNSSSSMPRTSMAACWRSKVTSTSPVRRDVRQVDILDSSRTSRGPHRCRPRRG